MIFIQVPSAFSDVEGKYVYIMCIYVNTLHVFSFSISSYTRSSHKHTETHRDKFTQTHKYAQIRDLIKYVA